MTSDQNAEPLRSLATLKWPYAGDEDVSYIDPLARNDPKQLRTAHYEAMATSPKLRTILADARLRTLLARLDALSNFDRERALELLIGTREPRPGPHSISFEDDEVRLFRAFAQEVESQIGDADKKAQRERLGLDWDMEE
ncbi:hypothetical protein BKA62DRAFT_768191 [Auriculariales sp. MPI-PUGE-AT-0066]|nr:hypothetical protein BKA62DRAFT_768191 [Auriculariales sp. MPI-PUGE-AT-0066]